MSGHERILWGLPTAISSLEQVLLLYRDGVSFERAPKYFSKTVPYQNHFEPFTWIPATQLYQLLLEPIGSAFPVFGILIDTCFLVD